MSLFLPSISDPATKYSSLPLYVLFHWALSRLGLSTYSVTQEISAIYLFLKFQSVILLIYRRRCDDSDNEVCTLEFCWGSRRRGARHVLSGHHLTTLLSKI